MKDLVRRESHRPRSGDFWDRLIASKGETRALGRQAGIDRQRYEIQKETAVELLVMRNRPPPPPWEDRDLIAYFSEEGKPQYGRIISAQDDQKSEELGSPRKGSRWNARKHMYYRIKPTTKKDEKSREARCGK